VILQSEFNCTDVNNIKALYRQTYYPVAIQLLDKGMTEADIKTKYRKALIFFCEQYKQNTFDHVNLDIVLYLLTLCLLE